MKGFFLEYFLHLNLYEQRHKFWSVCGDSVSDAHLASRRHSDSLSLFLSLSLSHTHTSLPLPSQIRAVCTFLLVWFVSKRVREARGFCRIQARSTALLNQQQAQLTEDRRIDIHGHPQRLRLIREKFSQANKLRKC